MKSGSVCALPRSLSRIRIRRAVIENQFSTRLDKEFFCSLLVRTHSRMQALLPGKIFSDSAGEGRNRELVRLNVNLQSVFSGRLCRDVADAGNCNAGENLAKVVCIEQ